MLRSDWQPFGQIRDAWTEDRPVQLGFLVWPFELPGARRLQFAQLDRGAQGDPCIGQFEGVGKVREERIHDGQGFEQPSLLCIEPDQVVSKANLVRSTSRGIEPMKEREFRAFHIPGTRQIHRQSMPDFDQNGLS